MEQFNENKIICHIVGLNPNDKDKIIKKCNELKKYNIIDLDYINNDILNNEEMSNMFKSYYKLKNNKNDKYKDIDKKMSKFWEDSMIKIVYNNVISKKNNILLGKNHHYRLMSKKINFKVSNKFIIDNNIKEEVKKKIKHILVTKQNDIINGTFPVEFLDYKYQLEKRKSFDESYVKQGYIKINLENIINILSTDIKNKVKGKGLWVSMKEPFNIGSKINPHNGPLFAYIDPVLALINSFNSKNNEIEYKFKNNKVITFDNSNNKKLMNSRYLYYVSKEHFMLYDTEKKHKYITNNYAEVLEKEKIKNVYNKLVDLNLIS